MLMLWSCSEVLHESMNQVQEIQMHCHIVCRNTVIMAQVINHLAYYFRWMRPGLQHSWLWISWEVATDRISIKSIHSIKVKIKCSMSHLAKTKTHWVWRARLAAVLREARHGKHRHARVLYDTRIWVGHWLRWVTVFLVNLRVEATTVHKATQSVELCKYDNCLHEFRQWPVVFAYGQPLKWVKTIYNSATWKDKTTQSLLKWSRQKFLHQLI